MFQTASVIIGCSLFHVIPYQRLVYLWAKPSDMALISLGGSPVMRLSIWPLMHLISSATAGLWMQLRSNFSWRPVSVRDAIASLIRTLMHMVMSLTFITPPSFTSLMASCSWASLATTFFSTFFKLFPSFPSTRAVAAEWQRLGICLKNGITPGKQ